MQLTRTVNESDGIVCVTITGEICLRTILAEISSVTSQPSYNPNLSALVDLRQATSHMTADEILTLTQSIKLQPKTPQGTRRALLVNSDLMYGLYRIFAAFSEGGPVHYRVFECEKEARQWLKGS
jgi:3,4-dihydroxy-2-butanone 4-phosphate synthase